jgi:hypothetical protein
MRKLIQVTSALLVVMIANLIVQSHFTKTVSADSPAAPVEFSVDEVGKHLTLIGRLGKPLGTMMTVRGKWSYPKELVKDGSLRFTVSHVNDQPLGQPFEFNIRQLAVVTKNGTSAIPTSREGGAKLAGTEWTIRAYESGSVEIIPADFWKETAPYARPYYFRDFTSKLNGVLQR